MSLRLLIGFLFFSLTLGFWACTEGETDSSEQTTETPTYGQKDLYGHWNVVKAKRNGQDTESLYGAYFDFQESGTMTTNISGEDDETPFEYKPGTLIQKGGDPLTYTVQFQTDSTLTLLLEIQGTQFEMALLKDR